MAENQIIVYQPNETVRLDVWLANETVWLNQSRIGELFGVDTFKRQVIAPSMWARRTSGASEAKGKTRGM